MGVIREPAHHHRCNAALTEIANRRAGYQPLGAEPNITDSAEHPVSLVMTISCICCDLTVSMMPVEPGEQSP